MVYLGELNHVRTIHPVLDELKSEDIILVPFRADIKAELRKLGRSYVEGEAFIPISSLGTDDFLPIALQRIVDKLEPKLLIAMNPSFEPIAGRTGIPSLMIRHGMLMDHPAHLHKLQNTHVACLGNHDQDLLHEKSGIPMDRLHITGFSRFDHISCSQQFSKAEIIKKYGLDPSHKHILLVTQPHQNPWDLTKEEADHLVDAMLSGTVKLVNEGLPVQLLIKTHPRENPSFYFDPILEYKLDVKVFHDQVSSIQELICISDVVVTVSSTAGLEALLLDKPLVTINFSSDPEPIPFQTKGGSLGVNSEQDLVPTLKRALAGEQGPDVEGFINLTLHKQDGRSSERIAKLIRSLAEAKNNVGQ